MGLSHVDHTFTFAMNTVPNKLLVFRLRFFLPSCKSSATVRVNAGGGGCGRRDRQKMRENAGKCGKCGKKRDRKCGFVRMVFAPRNPYVSSHLAQLGAQSMDGLMEQLSAVVQLKNITD